MWWMLGLAKKNRSSFFLKKNQSENLDRFGWQHIEETKSEMDEVAGAMVRAGR